MLLRPAVSILSILLCVGAGGGNVQAAGVTAHHHSGKTAGATASTRAYNAAMAAMHKNMRVALSGDADVDFVRQMIPHHQGAVDMARVELRYGKDEHMKAFARWVIRAQEQEIASMKNWLERRDNGKRDARAKDYYGDAMMTMHHAMMVDYTGDADVDFARGMIPHHQGALDMADIWFTHGSDPDLKTLVSDIYTSQSGEITMMRGWLAAHTTTK